MTVITGTAPQPGTTFPWPELPMAFKRLPKAVFWPMLNSQNRILFRYCIRTYIQIVYLLSKIDANFIICSRSCSFHSCNYSGITSSFNRFWPLDCIWTQGCKAYRSLGWPRWLIGFKVFQNFPKIQKVNLLP